QAQFAKAGLLGAPSYFGEPGEVDECALVAQRQGAVAGAGSGPVVIGIVLRRFVMAFLETLFTGTVKGKLQFRIGEMVRRDRGGRLRLLPVLAKEQWRAVILRARLRGGEHEYQYDRETPGYQGSYAYDQVCCDTIIRGQQLSI